ncbi:unnamed protein product [Prunus armeniaca]|uniref:Uncharacterized protein n=1 Tax=Prunus armeniaca TaxID=36596 RepID=A0A6J5UQ41_PRUAR|nr:unnamed protein product [Prunus armeniaca]
MLGVIRRRVVSGASSASILGQSLHSIRPIASSECALCHMFAAIVDFHVRGTDSASTQRRIGSGPEPFSPHFCRFLALYQENQCIKQPD